jgi:hypothetical protein
MLIGKNRTLTEVRLHKTGISVTIRTDSVLLSIFNVSSKSFNILSKKDG